jgi:3-dehydroquinate synthase
MPDALEITVQTASRTYPVHVGENLVGELDQLITKAGSTGLRFVVSSPPIWKLHGAAIRAALNPTETFLVADGEQAKTLPTAAQLYDPLIRAGADRSVTLVAVGGGVLGDMVGLVAATYLRGVQLVHVPTTLLAQVDSSIGGKVGVNHALGKNLIGAFHQPIAVVTDPRLLETLPRREFRAGLYEVIKYGVIASRDLFDRIGRDLKMIVARQADVLVPIIAESCRIKASVVAEDEQEKGLRRILNFGHTIGHAIEAVTGYSRLRHGEAVAFGMQAAAHLSATRGLLPDSDRDALAQLVAALGPLPSVSDLNPDAVAEAIRRDKKVLHGRLHMVLTTALGQTTIVDDVTEAEIRDSLAAIGIRKS